jgi:hypothetical protein
MRLKYEIIIIIKWLIIYVISDIASTFPPSSSLPYLQLIEPSHQSASELYVVCKKSRLLREKLSGIREKQRDIIRVSDSV